MIPPIRRANADDEDPGPQGHTGISAGATGFQRRMPAIGAELDKDAQVWEVYVDETDRSDKELVKSWNELVIESSKRLQPDPAETATQTLQAISQILIAISNGKPVDSFTSSDVSPSQFSTFRSSVLVNALWYLSLTLSVAVSLVAMVSKSWCNVFMSNRTGPKYEQGRRRQRKWNAIERWGMENVFVYLPALMHLALLLFALGLSVYLWDLCVSVAVPVFFVTVVVVSLYAVATTLPLVHEDCPYSTPLSKSLDKAVSLVDWTALLHRLQKSAQTSPRTRQDSRDPTLDSPVRQTTLMTGSTPIDKVPAQMLLWLISNCEDSQLVDIALQSIAGACPGFPVEILAEADVTKMVVQRLNSCLASDLRTDTICLKPAISIEVVALYAQALARLLEYDAGFRSSPEHQLNRKQLGAFFNPDMSGTMSELKSRFFDRRAEGDDIITVAASIAIPLYYRMSADNPSASPNERISAMIRRRKYDVPIRIHLDRGPAIDSRAFLTLLEAVPHWIIRRMTSMNNGERGSSIVLLVQLIHSPSCSAAEFQYAIGLSLVVAAILMHDYPGWEHPLNDIEDRATRALEVYRYYKVDHHAEPKALIVSGLLGLLRGASRTPTALRQDEVEILTDVLAQIEDFPSVAGFRLHTLPDTLTITQHAKTTLLETLQAVADACSDFGEAALILCLTQLLDEVNTLSDSSICEAALEAFLGARNSVVRRICSKLRLECVWELDDDFKEDLEPAQISRLIDISLGDDAYSAPAAMTCLWIPIERLIEAANATPDGQSAAVLAGMLKHDAFTSLRAKAPDLPVSPRNILEVGFAEMWYHLLKEMKSHKYASSFVNESRIITYMRFSNGVEGIPYLEELRDGRSWDNILMEMESNNRSGYDVEI
ncbi:hypothetical protein FRC09_003561 [Ceratobasidium sp. 395]|nr:hypothetical protein FRC09_003561 [Ceratobasidium sp. 395]